MGSKGKFQEFFAQASNAYVKWKVDMLVANRILCEGGNVLKQLSEQALKFAAQAICCSV